MFSISFVEHTGDAEKVCMFDILQSERAEKVEKNSYVRQIK